MICPHCKKDIPDSAVAKHLAAKGGKKSKRTITIDDQAKMQEARLGNRQITTKQLADYLSISMCTVRNSINDGNLIAEMIGGKYQIRIREAIQWWGRCYTGDKRDTMFESIQMFRDLEKVTDKRKHKPKNR